MSAGGLRYVFGPVPSRRLGRSLGVDLIPFKTCPYDCVYCQLGRTTERTRERREYVPVEEILSEVTRKLEDGEHPDFITLGGSGEPTLHSGMARIIAGIKEVASIPVAVLTNGALLGSADVQEDLRGADVVLPSLCAADSGLFEHVNRPVPEISFSGMVDGLVEFTAGFPGEVWLEVFLLGGLTASSPEVQKIAAICRRIRPARVQLNTISRPPAEDYALAVSPEQMAQLALLFEGNVEVISDSERAPELSAACATLGREDVLALIARHPCRVEDLAVGLGIELSDAAAYLKALAADGHVRASFTNGECFYSRTSAA